MMSDTGIKEQRAFGPQENRTNTSVTSGERIVLRVRALFRRGAVGN
jgi:hypothetical protein